MSFRRTLTKAFFTTLLFLVFFSVLIALPVGSYMRIAAAKITGNADRCSMSSTLMPSWQFLYSLQQLNAKSRTMKGEGGIVLVRTPVGDFWAPQGTDLFFVLAEEQVRVYGDGQFRVRRGDIVLDCGANVGVFTREALNAGARLVVAIEPVPVNVQCLQRTFAPEIASGRVIVVPKGLWHQPDQLKMTLFQNSALDSFVMHTREEESRANCTEVMLPLVPLDAIVDSLSLSRVDFIKMDIEGAERNALKGAAKTIRRWKPRMSIATENLPDDSVVVPEIVLRILPDYQITCGPCELKGYFTVRPQVLYFRPGSI